jgi:hypothetical protein
MTQSRALYFQQYRAKHVRLFKKYDRSYYIRNRDKIRKQQRKRYQRSKETRGDEI